MGSKQLTSSARKTERLKLLVIIHHLFFGGGGRFPLGIVTIFLKSELRPSGTAGKRVIDK